MFKPIIAAAFAASLTGPALANQNIVLIEADDLSFEQVKITPTPNIDRLAQLGVTFTQAHATASVCRPSRAATQTGVYQQRYGIFRNPDEAMRDPTHDPDPLPASAVTIAEMLKPAGYQSYFYGKWHLGYAADNSPYAQGNEDGASYRGGGHPYYTGWLQSARKNGLRFQGNLTEALGRMAADRIRSLRGQKWMVQVQTPAAHAPLQSDASQTAACGRFEGQKRTMCGMVVGLDRAVGEVLDALEDSGQADNTTVIFTADQGCASGGICDVGDLRGAKGSVFEGGMRVPLIVYSPGGLTGGRERADVVSLLDIAPTALKLAGEPIPARLDGFPLNAPKIPGRTLFFAPDPGRVSALRWPYKLYYEGHQWLLYNLAEDPRETRNLIGQIAPTAIGDLKSEALAWNATLPAPRN
jgi:arylsulfatase A-like enzyme